MTNREPRNVLKQEKVTSEAFTLHQGNSLKLKKILGKYFTKETLNENLVDVTITSPPYADLKVDDYKSNPEEQIGKEDEYEEYLESLRKVFKQVYGVTKTSGTLWIIVNTYKKGGRVVNLPWDIAEVCENLDGVSQCPDCGSGLSRDRNNGGMVCPECRKRIDTLEHSWNLHDVVIWDKERALPYSDQNAFRNVFEYVLVFKKSDSPKLNLDKVRIADPSEFAHWWVDWPERYHPRGKVPENIWSMVTPTQGKWGDLTIDHPAPFPPELVERIVSFTTDYGDIVLDPFGGTGMTLAQASAMNRYGVGVELSEDYCNTYEQLREEIDDRWESIKNDGATLEQEQRDLARVIWGLRQSVYARKMFLSLRRKFDADKASEIGGNSIFVITEDTDPGTDPDRETIQTEILFIFDDAALTKNHRSEIENHLEELKERNPWQGFGINANISVLTVAELSQQYNNGLIDWTEDRLFLYNGSKHYRFQRSIEFDEWVNRASRPIDWRADYASNGYPPTLSNIRIQIDREGERPEIEGDLLDSPPEEIPDDVTDTIKSEPKATRLDDF